MEECSADIIFPPDGSFNIVGFQQAGGMPAFRVENVEAVGRSARDGESGGAEKKKTVT